MYKIIRLLLFISLFCICGFDVHADYISTNKEKVVYEITSITAETEGIHVEGWGFINETQHYNDTSTYKGELLLKSAKDEFQVPLSFKYKDMTYLMKMQGRRRCGDQEYQKSANECFYDYSMVGFEANIPYEKLMPGNDYSISLGITALQSNDSYRTYIFAAGVNIDYTYNKTKKISIDSDINRTQFYVNHDFVFARKKPDKYADVLQNPSNICSAEYGSNVYFDLYSQYNNVLDYTIKDDITWYKVKGDIKGCKYGKYIVNEGETYELWIPSTFVEYNGNLTMIHVNEISAGPPTIVVENPTIYKGDTTFNPDDYVYAFDAIDGNLIPKQRVNKLNINQVGRYLIIYSATNSARQSAYANMYVTVIDKPENTKPILYVNDIEVYQYDTINYFQNVHADDIEDGDLTRDIVLIKEADSSIVGKQEACYYVEDSGKLNDTKCITVTVKRKEDKPNAPVIETENYGSLRFISIENPFENEIVPSIWNINTIKRALSSKNSILTGGY